MGWGRAISFYFVLLFANLLNLPTCPNLHASGLFVVVIVAEEKVWEKFEGEGR
jgi:hypothetical protein